MKVVMYASDKPREIMLAKALGRGVVGAGDEFEMRRTADYGEDDEGNDRKYPGPTPDTDVAVFFGVKGQSGQILEDHRAVGKATIYMDKGITREKGRGHTLYSRMFINGKHPLDYMMSHKMSGDRFDKLGIKLAKRQKGTNIVFCGSSPKFHEFHGLVEPTEFATSIIRSLRKHSERPIVYRPKPSWRRARPIPGTLFSGSSQTIDDVLRGAHCLITYGSGAAFFAICRGVPVISLGPSIAHPVAAHSVTDVENLTWTDEEHRRRWANAVAWTQFTTKELSTGFAWEHIRSIIQRP